MRALLVILALAMASGSALAKKTADPAAGTFQISYTLSLGDLLAACRGTDYAGATGSRESISRAASVCVPSDDSGACAAKTEAYCAAFIPACPISPNESTCAQAGVDDGLCTAAQGAGKPAARKRCARLAAAKGVGGCSVTGDIAACDERAVRKAHCPSEASETIPDPAACLDHLERWLKTKGLNRAINLGYTRRAAEGQDDLQSAEVIE